MPSLRASEDDAGAFEVDGEGQLHVEDVDRNVAPVVGTGTRTRRLERPTD